MGINVLSLFDGMSCGQIALERAGIKVDNYFASEIKPHAIKVTQYNYPKTIQLGDVTEITKDMLPNIDMVIGGSPCQDFSSANNNRLGLKGEKSKLFFEYLRILKELKPKYFLLENVVMDFMQSSFISDCLNCYPIRINSSLVSAQNRERFYWTNIGPSDVDLFYNHICNIPPPEDKFIQLKDILEDGFCNMNKSRSLLSSDSRPLATPTKMFHRYNDTGFTTCVFKDEQAYMEMLAAHTKSKINQINQINQVKEFGNNPHTENRIYSDVGKIGTLTTVNSYNFKIFSKNKIRYLTQKELERLQTVPEGYTNIIKRNQAADCLGDGWTVEVIAYIFSFLPKEYKQ